MELERAIRDRRTHKRYAGGPVDDEVLRALVELATWAPNHHLTEPWRFTVVRGPALAGLNAAAAQALQAMRKGGDDDRLAKKQQKLARRIESAAAVIAVSYLRTPGDAERDREDYAAACCAAQNLLLAAHGRGLASLWSTGKVFDQPAVRAFLGQTDAHGGVGTLFLGWPCDTPRGRRARDVDAVTRWL